MSHLIKISIKVHQTSWTASKRVDWLTNWVADWLAENLGDCYEAYEGLKLTPSPTITTTHPRLAVSVEATNRLTAWSFKRIQISRLGAPLWQPTGI